MFRKYTFLFSVLYCATGVLSSTLISPCKVEDSACIEKSVQAVIPKIVAGIPELGVESSDPLFLEKIEGNLSILKYVFYNTTVIGFLNCATTNIKVNPDLTKLHYELTCPKLDLSGQYEINGRLVILPVEGKGDYEMSTGKYNVIVDCELKQTTGSDGKTYLTIKNFKLKCHPISANTYKFKNLFNGQKDLSDAVHKFAHESWQEVQELVQEPTWYGCLKKVISNVNKYLKTVPLSDFKLN